MKNFNTLTILIVLLSCLTANAKRKTKISEYTCYIGTKVNDKSGATYSGQSTHSYQKAFEMKSHTQGLNNRIEFVKKLYEKDYKFYLAMNSGYYLYEDMKKDKPHFSVSFGVTEDEVEYSVNNVVFYNGYHPQNFELNLQQEYQNEEGDKAYWFRLKCEKK